MKFSNIHPFVRYVHYLPIDSNSNYNETIPYDNRLFFTCFGKGQISVNGKVYDMNEGSVIIIPSGTKYRLLIPEKTVTYIAVNFDYTQENSDKQAPIPPTAVSSYNPSMKLEDVDFNDMMIFNDIVHIDEISVLSGGLLKIHKEYVNKMIYAEHIISNLFGEILLRCARALYARDFNSNSEAVNTIIGYINENFNNNLSNKQISEKFNLHPNYISKLIKVFTGMPLHRYIMHIRISKSLEMLESNTYTIAEIAEKCGFCSIYHYSKIFKKIMGVSPSKY